MTYYELYILEDGLLKPTGIETNGYGIEQAEIEFKKIIKEINKPCTIMIKPYKGNKNG